jgi:hypothetical protein
VATVAKGGRSRGKRWTISIRPRLNMAAYRKAVPACALITARIFMRHMCVIWTATNWPPFVVGFESENEHGRRAQRQAVPICGTEPRVQRLVGIDAVALDQVLSICVLSLICFVPT